MTTEGSVPGALFGGDWAWLHSVRERLEADGGAVTVVLDLAILTPGQLGTLRWLMRWSATASGRKRVSLARLERELSTRVTAGLGLRETLAVLKGGDLADRRAELRTDRARKEQEAKAAHADLLPLTAGVPELAREHEALLASPPSPGLRVPSGSRCRTTSWPVYDAAVRAAVVWYRSTATGQRVAAKELAGQAWQNTKGWTLPRQIAFQNLVGRPFEQAVDEADTEIRLRGPLTWVSDDIVADADAAACRPWLSVPSHGIRSLGYTRCDAVGVLLVENLEAFQRVCEIPEVAEKWLCVWGQGYVRTGLVKFLQNLDLPLAAWGDLDADGIKIIADIAERVRRPIRAVGMDVALWQNGVKREQSAGQLARGRELAASLRTGCPPSLRELASAIATSGHGCEQETLYAEVLPTLPAQLEAVLSEHR